MILHINVLGGHFLFYFVLDIQQVLIAKRKRKNEVLTT